MFRITKFFFKNNRNSLLLLQIRMSMYIFRRKSLCFLCFCSDREVCNSYYTRLTSLRDYRFLLIFLFLLLFLLFFCIFFLTRLSLIVCKNATGFYFQCFSFFCYSSYFSLFLSFLLLYLILVLIPSFSFYNKIQNLPFFYHKNKIKNVLYERNPL